LKNKILEKFSEYYLTSWLKVLEGDNKLIVYASAKAGKAVEYIRNTYVSI